MSTISSSDLAKIARRHPNIPQDAMVDEVPVVVVQKEKREVLKSVKWKTCPLHVPSGLKKLTGLLPSVGDDLIFRDHNKRIGSHTVPCPGSGTVWIDVTA